MTISLGSPHNWTIKIPHKENYCNIKIHRLIFDIFMWFLITNSIILLSVVDSKAQELLTEICEIMRVVLLALLLSIALLRYQASGTNQDLFPQPDYKSLCNDSARIQAIAYWYSQHISLCILPLHLKMTMLLFFCSFLNTCVFPF